jgi:hypothetical protein
MRMTRRFCPTVLAFGLLLASAHPALAQAETAPGERCTLSHTPCVYPELVVALDGGVSHFTESGPFGFDTSVGSITKLGPSWGARVGMEIFPWFAIEAHYIGMSNHANDSVSIGGQRGLLTNAGVAELRFTLPTRFVQPYVFIGAGVYSTSVNGSSESTQLTGSTELGMPLGLGFGVPLAPGVNVGAEAVYHRLFGESFAANDDIGGGDPLTLNAVLRFRL